jgi:hypothetical protein
LGVQDIEPPRTGNPEIVDTESSIAEIWMSAITNKYPGPVYVAQQV